MANHEIIFDNFSFFVINDENGENQMFVKNGEEVKNSFINFVGYKQDIFEQIIESDLSEYCYKDEISFI